MSGKSINDPRIIKSLPDSKELLRSKFGDQEFTNKESLVIFNRQSTEKGAPITKTFSLNFDHITQAVLKVSLLADQGRILGFIPNEFKLTEFIVNGKRFIPSDPRQSINVIDKVNDTSLNKVLRPNGENTISINFDAPIGAGVTSPHAEIVAILILNGKKNPFALPTNLTNITQSTKDVQAFVKDNLPLTIFLIIAFVASLIALAFITTKGTKGAVATKGITGDIKTITQEVKG